MSPACGAEAVSALLQGDSEERQLGLFFFKEADAKALIDKASTAHAPHCCALHASAEPAFVMLI